MATNKILPWAQTGTANVLSDADYASDVATGGSYADGVKSGQASSKQANKTWRQATAPASGLGQFLVDNLNVDVTDSDTPATFSSRIANAILKLAQISPFNQSFAAATGGYRKYAIVSDSSGNYWSSTADQNVTVPGVSGAKWQSLFDGYATNTALQSEASSRASADTNLQNQVNNRVLKSGDTSTGNQVTSNDYSNGSLHWGPVWRSDVRGWNGGQSIGDYSFGLFTQHIDNSYTEGILSLNSFVGRNDFKFREDGNIYTPLGTVALKGDLGTVTSSGNDWFWMKLPNGWIIQGGNAKYYAADGTNGTTIKLPTSFGSQFVVAIGNDIGSNANAVTVMRVDGSTIRLLGREVTSGTLQNTSINYLCIGNAP